MELIALMELLNAAVYVLTANESFVKLNHGDDLVLDRYLDQSDQTGLIRF